MCRFAVRDFFFFFFSKVAAGEGIAKCCAARVIWNVPCTGVVPVAYSYYAATKLAKAKPMLNIPVHIGLVVMGISAGLFPGQVCVCERERKKGCSWARWERLRLLTDDTTTTLAAAAIIIPSCEIMP